MNSYRHLVHLLWDLHSDDPKRCKADYAAPDCEIICEENCAFDCPCHFCFATRRMLEKTYWGAIKKATYNDKGAIENDIFENCMPRTGTQATHTQAEWRTATAQRNHHKSNVFDDGWEHPDASNWCNKDSL